MVENIPDGLMGLDIGPNTVEAYSKVISSAKTIIWNGPMGCSKTAIRQGTVAWQGCQFRRVRGRWRRVGEAVRIRRRLDKISHISTGGGASLPQASNSQASPY